MSIYDELETAGLIDARDVTAGRSDGIITAENGRLNGGDGDDVYVGDDNISETFFFDGRHDNNDEGRHVNVVKNFDVESDKLSFRMDGGFFKDADGEKVEQTTNGNVAHFDSARDIADLLLFVNLKHGQVEGIGKTIDQADIDANTAGNGKVDGTFRKELKSDKTEGSYVRVVGDHIVLNIDDGSGNGETVDKWGNYQTNDVMIVFEDLEKTLAADFANELGYANEFASNADSVHIATPGGQSLVGGDGDNLFILSNGADTVDIKRGFNNNDEGKHVNIVHGFDLAEDSLKFDSDFKDLFTIGATTGNGKFATFEGAAGIAGLLGSVRTVSNVDDSSGDLHFDIKLKGGDPMTIVLTDTTLEDVYTAAATQVWDALADADNGIDGNQIPATGTVGGNGDGIILNGDDNKGDDLLIASAGANTFRWDSRDAAEDGTQGKPDGATDLLNHVNVVLGFGSDDEFFFRIDGGYFAGAPFPGNNNQATVSYDEIDDLAAFINAKGTGTNDARYDSETNSTILTLDDSPSNPNDDLTIVLWDSGNLL